MEINSHFLGQGPTPFSSAVRIIRGNTKLTTTMTLIITFSNPSNNICQNDLLLHIFLINPGIWESSLVAHLSSPPRLNIAYHNRHDTTPIHIGQPQPHAPDRDTRLHRLKNRQNQPMSWRNFKWRHRVCFLK